MTNPILRESIKSLVRRRITGKVSGRTSVHPPMARAAESVYYIMYNGAMGVEEVDEAYSLPEARRLLREYRMAYGPGSDLWIQSSFGKRVESSQEQLHGLTKKQQRLLQLVKDAGPRGYQVGPFANQDANVLYRRGLVEISKDGGATSLTITDQGRAATGSTREQSMTFDRWMKEVDREVDRKAFVSVHDLADQPYNDWWRDGMTPKEAARRALKAEGFPG